MKLPLVVITWKDATSRNEGWQHISDYAESRCLVIRTTGFLIHKDKDHHTLVMSIDDDSTMKGDYGFSIPNGCIQSVRKVGEFTVEDAR